MATVSPPGVFDKFNFFGVFVPGLFAVVTLTPLLPVGSVGPTPGSLLVFFLATFALTFVLGMSIHVLSELVVSNTLGPHAVLVRSPELFLYRLIVTHRKTADEGSETNAGGESTDERSETNVGTESVDWSRQLLDPDRGLRTNDGNTTPVGDPDSRIEATIVDCLFPVERLLHSSTSVGDVAPETTGGPNDGSHGTDSGPDETPPITSADAAMLYRHLVSTTWGGNNPVSILVSTMFMCRSMILWLPIVIASYVFTAVSTAVLRPGEEMLVYQQFVTDPVFVLIVVPLGTLLWLAFVRGYNTYGGYTVRYMLSDFLDRHGLSTVGDSVHPRES